LLHHVATGASYDLDVLARGDLHTGVRKPEGELRARVTGHDQFERAEAMPKWGAFIDQRVQALQNLKKYLIPLWTNWGEYELAPSRFHIKLRMDKLASFGSAQSYHCAGTYKKEKNNFLTACVTAVNLNGKDPFLNYFPIQDTGFARHLSKYSGKYKVWAVAEPAGKYRILRGNEIRYMPLDIYAASGIQPVRITELILADAYDGRIFAVSKSNDDATGTPLPATETAADGKIRVIEEPPFPTIPSPVESTPSDGQTGWRVIARDPAGIFYADTNSVKRKDGLVSVRMLIDFTEPGSTGTRSDVGLYEYNCNKRTSRRLAFKKYSSNMGEGAVTAESSEPFDFGFVQKKTNSELMFNFACNAVPRTP
jgi:hypothetical protein